MAIPASSLPASSGVISCPTVWKHTNIRKIKYDFQSIHFLFYFCTPGNHSLPVIPVYWICAFIAAFVRQRTEGFGGRVSMSIQQFRWMTDRENIMENFVLKNVVRSAMFISVVMLGAAGMAHAAGTGDQVGEYGDMSGQGGPVSKQRSQGSQGAQRPQGAQGSGAASKESSGSSMPGQSAPGQGGESVSHDREHMSDIGRKGGEHSHGGTSDEHSKGGSHGNKGNRDDDKSHSGRGGSSEQHAKAGRQSHKND
jgi:general stress protein YciG